MHHYLDRGRNSRSQRQHEEEPYPTATWSQPFIPTLLSPSLVLPVLPSPSLPSPSRYAPSTPPTFLSPSVHGHPSQPNPPYPTPTSPPPSSLSPTHDHPFPATQVDSLVYHADEEVLFSGYEMQACSGVYEKYVESGAAQDRIQASLCLGLRACPTEMSGWMKVRGVDTKKRQ